MLKTQSLELGVPRPKRFAWLKLNAFNEAQLRETTERATARNYSIYDHFDQKSTLQ